MRGRARRNSFAQIHDYDQIIRPNCDVRVCDVSMLKVQLDGGARRAGPIKSYAHIYGQ